MSSSWSSLPLRLLFVTAVPIGCSIVGFEVESSAKWLSAIAAAIEVGLSALSGSSQNARGGRKGKQANLRPPHFFPLQVGVLYCLQLWVIMLGSSHVASSASDLASSTSDQEAPDQVFRGRSAAEVAAEPLERLAGESTELAERLATRPVGGVGGVAFAQEAAERSNLESDLPAARHIPGQKFNLDAPLSELKWKPKTISVVLPCAEERDYAFKTVRSFFEMTPSHVLHEIVVVDDGSNPPLADTHLKEDIQKKYKVKICRHENTVGLIGAKKTGGDAATGDIVAFFDCHVAPQTNWYEDFLRLIGQNYRRMVVPQITALNVDTWTQEGSGGGMSKCYVTWDGDFKWGGPDDMYMGMLSGGLLGLSKRWWDESGGYDSEMLGWGGENIDQGVRMWVCGGEIVAAPNSQVAHMWRTGSKKTNARYKHVGDTLKNRARAINAWYGDFSKKLDDFPEFKRRKDSEGDGWIGDMSTFQQVRDRLNGCRPFAWYLRRFKSVYEDGGLLPPDVFMIREEKSSLCVLFGGRAGTSGGGRDAVRLEHCDPSNDRFFWHLGNVNRKTGRCCSGLRAWNTDQCFEEATKTGICDITGRHPGQAWTLTGDGQLRRHDRCLGLAPDGKSLSEAPCAAFRAKGGGRFTKQAAKVPVETQLYRSAMKENPEDYKLLNAQLLELDKESQMGPAACRANPASCVTMFVADGSGRCLDDQGALVNDKSSCDALRVVGLHVQRAENSLCLDTWSDEDRDTFGFYGCHDGDNQKFELPGGQGTSRICTQSEPEVCFAMKPYPAL
mmetsp:Transcript_15535/g.33722  ORF Transcript_15535/g.33722 Transcript_15535/m.33722 type:complete len:785 (+) Transcript_15535:300-2654(+)